MVQKKTLTISDGLNHRLLEYEQINPYAKIQLSKILEKGLDEILQEYGF